MTLQPQTGFPHPPRADGEESDRLHEPDLPKEGEDDDAPDPNR